MDDAQRLVEGLKKQRDKYAEVAAIAERQRALLETNDLDGLLKLIEEKRARMEEIDVLKRETAGLPERWPEFRTAIPPDVVREVEAVVGQTRSLLEKILKIEEEDRQRFERGRDDRSSELRTLQQQKKLRDAYGQKDSGDTRFFDDKK